MEPILQIHENGHCTIITVNEDETTNLNPLVPGQFDKARRLLPDDLYEQVESLWTDEVIGAWKESLKEEQTDA